MKRTTELGKVKSARLVLMESKVNVWTQVVSCAFAESKQNKLHNKRVKMIRVLCMIGYFVKNKENATKKEPISKV